MFIDVNPAVALSGPRGVMRSNDMVYFFALLDKFPCKCNI